MSPKLALPAALLAILALSACNDDEDGGGASFGSEEPSTEATSSAPTEATETESTETETTDTGDSSGGQAGGAGAVTAPGTELKIGDTAVLPLTYGTEGTATVEITVTGIEEGTTKDLEAAEVKNAADYTPFYINLDMKILEVGDAGFGGYTPGSDFDGKTGDTDAGSLIIFGSFEPCDSGGFEHDSAVGDTATGCVPALATKGSVVDGVEFNGGPDDAGYDKFDGEPVVWRS